MSLLRSCSSSNAAPAPSDRPAPGCSRSSRRRRTGRSRCRRRRSVERVELQAGRGREAAGACGRARDAQLRAGRIVASGARRTRQLRRRRLVMNLATIRRTVAASSSEAATWLTTTDLDHQTRHAFGRTIGAFGLARERLLELRHVRHRPVDAVLVRRVRVGRRLQPLGFRPRVLAPDLRPAEEHALLGREAVDLARGSSRPGRRDTPSARAAGRRCRRCSRRA